MSAARHRVVVTGTGLVSPLGSEQEELRRRLLAGESAAGEISLFDASRLPTHIAAEVPESDSAIAMRDRKIAFALKSARAAVVDANRSGHSLAAHYANSGSICMGMGLELFSMPDMVQLFQCGGIPPNVDPQNFLQSPSDLCLHLISREFGFDLPPLLHVSACAASTDALGMAFRLVRSGARRWMLAGGSDSMINPMGVAGFCKIEAMTCCNDDPKHASRPFDRERDGFLLGEGAGVLVLESLEQAQQRGATIYAEILGYGNSFDAHGISEPHPEGEGALLAMQRALADAGVEPAAVSHINAHGTSTPKNDPVETLAIHRLLGERAQQITVNATKSMLGHLISASGAVELIAQIVCGNAGMIHPTINLEHPDPLCDLDYVCEGPRTLNGPIMLKNSFGFGGQNAALVFSVQPT